MEENKYKKWMFTWNAENDNSLISNELLKTILESLANTFVYQKEKVSREHYQGFFILSTRDRMKTLLNKIRNKLPKEQHLFIKNLTLEPMFGSVEDALNYCSKSESRISDTVYSEDIKPFIPQDLKIFNNKELIYPWQLAIHKTLFNNEDFLKINSLTKPDDRTILTIVDKQGNSGKSKFVKFLCYNYEKQICKLAFGTAQQLRSAVITAGRKNVYILDLPRTLGLSDNIYDIISVVEDIKNGFVCSSMYGKYEKLLMEPPHIIIFSNKEIDKKLMSPDRWKSFFINSKKSLIQGVLPEFSEMSYEDIDNLPNNI